MKALEGKEHLSFTLRPIIISFSSSFLFHENRKQKRKGEKRKHIRGNFTTLTILHHLHLWTVVALLHSPDEDQQTPPSAVLSRSQGRSFHVVVVQLASHLPFASNFSHPSRAASPTPAPSASVRGNSPDTNSAAIHIHSPFIVNGLLSSIFVISLICY